MATNYGTLTLFDQAAANQNVQAFTESRAYQVLSTDLAAYNASIQASLNEIAAPTADTLQPYGSIGDTEMVEVDELGTADAQRTGRTSTVGFPLRRYAYTIQWTRLWMQTNTVAELETQYLAARGADFKGILRSLKRALFIPTNVINYVDRFATRTTYNLRALVNADSEPIPAGPNGESFDSATHTHYLANATLTAAAATSLIETVVEHGHGGAVRVYINRAQEATWRALTGFAAYIDTRVIEAAGQARGGLDMSRLDNRAIGLFAGAEVWVKPWVPANYAFAFDASGPKPLGIRTRGGTTLGQLQIAADNETYPLRAQFMEREYGLAAWNRTNGAVLYSAGGAYVAPSIT
jgi:hypothetical protein